MTKPDPQDIAWNLTQDLAEVEYQEWRAWYRLLSATGGDIARAMAAGYWYNPETEEIEND